MNNAHLPTELRTCLRKCTAGISRHWEERLGLQRNNKKGASRPEFVSTEVTNFHRGTTDVVDLLKETYGSSPQLREAIKEPGFISHYTDGLLDKYGKQIWGEPASPRDKRPCNSSLCWEIEEDRLRYTNQTQFTTRSEANLSFEQDPSLPPLLDGQPSKQALRQEKRSSTRCRYEAPKIERGERQWNCYKTQYTDSATAMRDRLGLGS
jgi:hypothetical protein